MNTYRVYTLNVAAPLAPVVQTVYVRGEKYKDAWEYARATLNGDTAKTSVMFQDEPCSTKAVFVKGETVAKIVELKKRNVKLDKEAIKAILADPNAKAEDKLKALQELTAS